MRKQVTYSSRPNLAARAAHAKGARQFRTYDTSYIQNKHKRPPRAIAIVAVIVVAILLIVAGTFLLRGCSGNDHLVADGTPVSVTVESGSSTGTIAQVLYDAGLVANTGDFSNRVRELGAESSLKPGMYTFTGGTSVDSIITKLEEGPDSVTVSIPEGYTLDKIAESVASATNGSISADDFKAAAGNAQAYKADYPFVADAYDNSLEGFLFPKTYRLEADDTADSLVRMMLSQFAVETAGLNYSYPQSQGLSNYDALILASIVEREATADNRATVASVFYNRLYEGMPLQSDATVAYVVKDDPTPSDLTIDSPYNTYLVKELPAGPICSPSLESLKAVCNPDTTDYLYFYFARDSSGTMQYWFSQTYEEHKDAIGGTNTVGE